MKLLEVRKTFAEDFEQMKRVFAEWERNPSALLRGSLKKSMINCYEHLNKLDYLDIDKSMDAAPEINSETFRQAPQKSEIEAPKAEVITPEVNIIEDTKIIVENKASESVKPTVKQEPAIAAMSDVAKKDEQGHFLSGADEIELEKFFESQKNKIEFEAPKSEQIVTETKEKLTSEKIKIDFVEDNVIENMEVKVADIKQEVGTEKITMDAGEKLFMPESELQIEDARTSELLDEKPLLMPEIEMPKALLEKADTEQEIQKEESDTYKKIALQVKEKKRTSSFFSSESPKSNPQQLTLADKLAYGHKDEGVHYTMKDTAIADLNTAIPLAKKFEFIKELFQDDSALYKNAIGELNAAANLNAAIVCLESFAVQYAWQEDKSLAMDLKKYVDRRYLV